MLDQSFSEMVGFLSSCNVSTQAKMGTVFASGSGTALRVELVFNDDDPSKHSLAILLDLRACVVTRGVSYETLRLQDPELDMVLKEGMPHLVPRRFDRLKFHIVLKVRHNQRQDTFFTCSVAEADGEIPTVQFKFVEILPVGLLYAATVGADKIAYRWLPPAMPSGLMADDLPLSALWRRGDKRPLPEC